VTDTCPHRFLQIDGFHGKVKYLEILTPIEGVPKVIE